PTVSLARAPEATPSRVEVLPPPDFAPAPPPSAAPPSRDSTRRGSAARALSEQSLRQLGSADPERRAQAARNLSAAPAQAAAPDLAAALARETDPRVRGALAVALLARGGGGPSDLVPGLPGSSE